MKTSKLCINKIPDNNFAVTTLSKDTSQEIILKYDCDHDGTRLRIDCLLGEIAVNEIAQEPSSHPSWLGNITISYMSNNKFTIQDIHTREGFEKKGVATTLLKEIKRCLPDRSKLVITAAQPKKIPAEIFKRFMEDNEVEIMNWLISPEEMTWTK